MNLSFIRPATILRNPKLLFFDALNNLVSKQAIRSYKLGKFSPRTFSHPNKSAGTSPAETVIFKKDDGESVLAYRCNLTTDKSETTGITYLDADNGELVYCHTNTCSINTPTSVNTLYSGARTINTDSYSGGYRLYESNRSGAAYVRTLNWNHNPAADYYGGYASEWVDNDNNWTAAEYNNPAYDIVALDAHWAGEKTLDYFYTKFNRNSYDGQGSGLTLCVHTGVNDPNAYWLTDSKIILLGDGKTGGRPYAALDVIAHEFTHGVVQYEVGANTPGDPDAIYGLRKTGEQGALNESLSDMFGAAVEYYTDPTKATWTSAYDINPFDPEVYRYLDNPNLNFTPDPKYYQGNYWQTPVPPYIGANDYGWVHHNNGVGNFWFYLLVAGGSGTNQANLTYNISGIGMDQGAKVVYDAILNNTVTTATFPDFRDATILAARAAYGLGSCQEIAVINAWAAVGIGTSYNISSNLIQGTGRICSATQFNVSANGPTVSSWTITPAIASLTTSGNAVTAYNITDGTATLTATYSGCGYSGSTSRTVTVGAAGNTVTGTNPASPYTTYNYAFNRPNGGLLQSWSIPAGWTLNSWSITGANVTTGAAGSNGNLVATYNGCGNTYQAYLPIVVQNGGGIGTRIASEGNQGIIVSPNPVTTEINFTGSVTSGDITEIVDTKGNVLIRTVARGVKRETLNVSSLAPGTYVLRVTNRKTRISYISMFIKQ